MIINLLAKLEHRPKTHWAEIITETIVVESVFDSEVSKICIVYVKQFLITYTKIDSLSNLEQRTLVQVK